MLRKCSGRRKIGQVYSRSELWIALAFRGLILQFYKIVPMEPFNPLLMSYDSSRVSVLFTGGLNSIRNWTSFIFESRNEYINNSFLLCKQFN